MNAIKQLRALAILSLCVAVTLVTVAASAANDDIIAIANLTGAAINGQVPHGEARRVIQPDGNRKLEVEVEDVNLPAGTVFDVFVNGGRIGSLTLNSLKQGEIQLETERGQTVPAVASGTTVEVRTQAGALLVSGAFGAASPNPSPSPNPQNEVLFRASLAGPAIHGEVPHGSAKHVTKFNGDREIEVEVEEVNLPANTVLNVFVNGANIGSLVINRFQRGALEFETEDGHAVPAVSAGTTVDVRNQAGAVIVSGVFGAVAPPAPGTTPTPEEDKAIIQFGQVSFTVGEGARTLIVPVTRTGNLSHDSKIDFRSVDGSAVERSDFTTASGRLVFGPGETTKNITVLITDDSFVEGNETFSLMLFDARRDSIGNPGVAQITITDNDTSVSIANPVDVTTSFVVQHYMDFLNREPEPGGLQAWQDILGRCEASDDRCDRIEVSSAFFRSPEFQDRGYFLYRF
ncbi:MAG TPA: Calx-beta domain-containing protein, partial [Pyrinomonadaceae bacterium]